MHFVQIHLQSVFRDPKNANRADIWKCQLHVEPCTMYMCLIVIKFYTHTQHTFFPGTVTQFV